MEGSVLSLLELKFDGQDESPTPDDIKAALIELAPSAGIDPAAMQVQESKASDASDDRWRPLRDLRNWSVAAGLLLVLLSVAICLFVCSVRRRRTGLTHPMPVGGGGSKGGGKTMQTPIYHHYGGAAHSFYNAAASPLGAAGIYAGHANATTASAKDSPSIAQSPRVGRKKVSGAEGGGRGAPTPKGVGETTYQVSF